MPGRFADASTSTAASASRSGPRAHRQTRHPSATSARALASPSPRLDPVTIAILSASERSMQQIGNLLRPSTREIVQPPVERMIRHLELVLLHEFPLQWEEVGGDERDNR